MMQLVTETPILEHHHYQQLASTNQRDSQSVLHNYQQQDQNIEQQQQQQLLHQQQIQETHLLQPNLEDLTHNTSSTSTITPPVESPYPNTSANPLSIELRLASESADKLSKSESLTSTPIFIAPQSVESSQTTKSYTVPTTTSSGHCSVIASNMNIQPTGFTKNHLINNNGSASHLSSGLQTSDELSLKRRREDFSRRPSYRKIFNDLTGFSEPLDPPTAPLGIGTPIAGNDASAGSRVSPRQQTLTAGRTARPQTTSPSPQTMDMLSSVGPSSMNLQDLSATNSQSPVSVVDLPTNAIQQQQQHPTTSQTHHHNIQTNHLTATHLHPSSTPRHHLHHHHQQPQQPPQPPPQQQQHSAHHVPQQHDQQQPQQQTPLRPMHPILTPTSPPITGSGSMSSGSVVGNGEEATKKRELRLQKNREAAKECRRKKKEYIKCLENRVAVLENQNKALIDELKTLKDLYCKSANE